MQIPGARNLNLRNSFTIETWFKGDKTPENTDTVRQWLSKGNNYVLSWNHNDSYMQSIAFFNEQKVWPAAKIKGKLYAEEWYKAVHFACDTMEEIIRVMRYYGVTYITYDVYEAANPKTINDLYNGKIPGFELVYTVSNNLKLYKVHYDLLPSELEEPGGGLR